MTLSELYDQFCEKYREEDYAALAVLLQDNAALLSTNTFVFDTKEAYESVAVAERPPFSYIVATQSWTITTTDPITIIDVNGGAKALKSGEVLKRDAIKLMVNNISNSCTAVKELPSQARDSSLTSPQEFEKALP